MNKTIIAIAIATAMAAPVAMADVTVSGGVGFHLTMDDSKNGTGVDTAKASRAMGDKGRTLMQFDGTNGNGYARIGYQDGNQARDSIRDLYVGYKIGGDSTVQMGVMAGAAKNLEKDPYIATFLQMRGTAAEAVTAAISGTSPYGSSSFVGAVQYATKVSGMDVKVQYSPVDNSATTKNAGHLGLSIAGKASGINFWAAYNNGQANGAGTATDAKHVNAKAGASMKMGTIKLTVAISNADNNKTGVGASTSSTILADFALGNGLSANAGYGANGDTGTWMRVAVNKALNKGTDFYAGYVSTANAAGTDTGSQLGLVISSKF